MELVDCPGEAALVIIRSDHCGTKGRGDDSDRVVIEMRSVNIDLLVDLEQRTTASAFFDPLVLISPSLLKSIIPVLNSVPFLYK